MNEKDMEVYRKLGRLAALIVSLDDDGEYHALCEDNPSFGGELKIEFVGSDITPPEGVDPRKAVKFFRTHMALTLGSNELRNTVSTIKTLASELLFPRPSPNAESLTFTRYDLWERLKPQGVTATSTQEEGITSFKGIVLSTRRDRTKIALKY